LPVLAWFERVVAVSFAFPEEILRPLVPQPLEVDSHEGWGFGCLMGGRPWTWRLI